MITNDDRVYFLCTLENRYRLESRKPPLESFVWDQWDAAVYATGKNWIQALDAAILKWRKE